MPLKGEKHEKGGIGGAFSTLFSGDNAEVRDAMLDDSGNVTSTSRGERDNAQYRKASLLGTAPANASMAQQQAETGTMGTDIDRMRNQGIAGMQDSAGLARNLATNGDAAAGAIYSRGSDDAMRQARSLAASTSGGAGAQVAAARAGMSQAAQTQRSMTQDAAQQQALARRTGMEMYGQQQGQIANTMGQIGQLQGSMADRSLQRGALQNQQATSQLSADMQQRAQNDAFFMANQGLLSGRDQAQLQAYMQKSHDQANIDSGGDAGSTSIGGSVVGGTMTAGAGLIGMSDYRSKNLISDETTKNFLGVKTDAEKSAALKKRNLTYAEARAQANAALRKDGPLTIEPNVPPRTGAIGEVGPDAPVHNQTGAAPLQMKRELKPAVNVAPMAPVAPTAQRNRKAPLTEAERLLMKEETGQVARPEYPSVEGDSEEMFLNRLKAEQNIEDLNHPGNDRNMRRELREFDAEAHDKDPTPQTYDQTPVSANASRGGKGHLASYYGLNGDDPEAQKLDSMAAGSARDTFARQLRVNQANKEKALQSAEIEAGLREKPSDYKGAFAAIGSALKSLGAGFSGKQVDRSEDYQRQLDAQNTKMQEIQKQNADYAKKYQEALQAFNNYKGPGAPQGR